MNGKFKIEKRNKNNNIHCLLPTIDKKLNIKKYK